MKDIFQQKKSKKFYRLRKRIKKTFTLQQDQSDCGIACLLSVVRYYGGNQPFNLLRELSGTNKQGTTLLGLYQAANSIGFEARGVETNVNELKKIEDPVILPVRLDSGLLHYVVLYNIINKICIVGDPSIGIRTLSEEDLKSIWYSKQCLILKPNEKFIKDKDAKKKKREWLLKYLKPDHNHIFSSILLGFCLSLFSMAVAVFSQRLIDSILPKKDLNVLITTIGFLAFLLILQSVIGYIRNILLISQQKRFNNRIISYFFDAILHLPKVFFDTREIGDMVARLNDSRRVQNFISQMINSIVIDSTLLLVSLVFIFFYSKDYFYLSCIFFPIYYSIIRIYTPKVASKQKDIMVAYAKVESNYINAIGGISEIILNNKFEEFNSKNNSVYSGYQEKIYALGKFQSKLNFLNGILSSVFIIIVIFLGSTQVNNETLTLGKFIAILGISTSMIPYVTKLALVVVPLNEARIALERMFEVTNQCINSHNDSEERILIQLVEIQNLSFRYRGTKLLLKNINVKIKKNGIVSLVGESGSGKSTICNILCHFYDFEKGSIKINGTLDIRDIETTSWSNSISLVSQHLHIFNATIAENISLDFNEMDQEVYFNFINDLGLIEYFKEFPHGIETRIGESGINLSGGQKQLIGILRALYKKPDLLILDEATSAMDTNLESLVLSIIKNLSKDISILFITHRVHILKDFSDTIYILEDGSSDVFGTHNKLMKTKNYYSEYWNKICK